MARPRLARILASGAGGDAMNRATPAALGGLPEHLLMQRRLRRGQPFELVLCAPERVSALAIVGARSICFVLYRHLKIGYHYLGQAATKKSSNARAVDMTAGRDCHIPWLFTCTRRRVWDGKLIAGTPLGFFGFLPGDRNGSAS